MDGKNDLSAIRSGRLGEATPASAAAVPSPQRHRMQLPMELTAQQVSSLERLLWQAWQTL